MKKHFDMHYKINQKNFSFERDNHWNKIAHELVEKIWKKFQKLTQIKFNKEIENILA